MAGEKIKDKDGDAGYVIGLIDGENALSTNENEKSRPYGIPEKARGLEYFKKAKKGDLVLGYKTMRYRKRGKGKWKDLPRVPCKNPGIFAVFKVIPGFKDKSVFKDISGDMDNWLREQGDWDENYPNVIFLSKPLFILKNRISFEDLKTLIPKPEYVKDCRRSVTRFSKADAKKIFVMMRKKNPETTEEINKLF